ncbi:kinesin-like protein KIF20A [Neoarius graeffei]|uniref:kinesin-like protein KIF20A n=1 Tax=Neoarius graeffei TaxID=443677 RepID=UPI00298C4635|nr:kinesin-like protein KIF20A [Neoarius graeffei]XP_060792014.1 kinesin-like protein KIF20A [Neoarius graeffei]
MSAPVYVSDEEECVLESTAADLSSHTHARRLQAPITELSVIGPVETHTQQVNRDEHVEEKLQVFLRIRPLTDVERQRGEDQGCVCVQSEDTLLLKAPKDSHSMKSAERGVSQSVHKFTFTRIFRETESQQEVYDQMMKEMVRDVLHGENRLLYTYGVTNSGKTYTIQGSAGEAGLLPRALVSVFTILEGQLYPCADLKPVLKQEVRQLSNAEICAEEDRRQALLREEEVCRQRGGVNASVSWDSGISGLSAITRLEDSDGMCVDIDGVGLDDVTVDKTLQFGIWVSFYEIYNEFVYDLLEPPTSLHTQKRNTLRLSDDKHGNVYVKDLTWVNVRSADEAWRVLTVGRSNQSFASTHLNHNSSRSHSVFTVRVLHIQPVGGATHISELCVCDLAGSERCKDQQNGERMKEASNINTSLLTLGRCISAMRHNQTYRQRPAQVVPFRDSKLTRVLQSFFSGHGRACMMVNVNSCSSSYDETLHALKFSAIATQLVHGPASKNRVAYILSLLRDESAHADHTLMEDEEEEEESDEEVDVSMFQPEALLKAINVLKREVLRQRGEKDELEVKIREQVCTEMMEVMNRMQLDFSETMERERELLENRCENKINNLKSSLKKYYSQQLEERDDQIRELSATLKENDGGSAAPSFPSLEEFDGPRRSQRVASSRKRSSQQEHAESEHVKAELSRVKAELEQCRAELDLKQTELTLKTLELKRFQDHPGTSSLTVTAERKLVEGQKTLRQLRADLHSLVVKLQSGGRACCHYTDGEKLRTALNTADSTLLKQDQMLMDLHLTLQLLKAQLHHKDETLANFKRPFTPATPVTSATPSSCSRRGCGVAMAMVENQPPGKRTLLRFFSPSCSSKMRAKADTTTPYARILRSRQPSPPPSPALVRRGRV